MTDLADSYAEEIKNRTDALLRDFSEFKDLLDDYMSRPDVEEAIHEAITDAMDTTSGVDTKLVKVMKMLAKRRVMDRYPEEKYEEQKEREEREYRRDAYNDSRISEHRERMAMRG